MPALSDLSAWLLPLCFGLLWLLITLGNYAALLSAWRSDGSTSLVLFIGGIFGALALVAVPEMELIGWIWLPALLDPGSLFALGAILVGAVRERIAR